MRASPVLLIAILALPAYGQDLECNGEIKVTFESASGNSEETTFQGVHISDCTHDIIGARASTQVHESGRKTWHLEGEVRLTFGATVIDADSAVFEFEPDELQRDQLVNAELIGRPVRMSDFDATRNTAFSGTADSIYVDSRNTTLRLLGQATLFRGTNEREGFEGCDWIYNWGDHSFSAGTTECGGIILRLARPENRNAPDPQPASP